MTNAGLLYHNGQVFKGISGEIHMQMQEVFLLLKKKELIKYQRNRMKGKGNHLHMKCYFCVRTPYIFALLISIPT